MDTISTALFIQYSVFSRPWSSMSTSVLMLLFDSGSSHLLRWRKILWKFKPQPRHASPPVSFEKTAKLHKRFFHCGHFESAVDFLHVKQRFGDYLYAPWFSKGIYRQRDCSGQKYFNPGSAPSSRGLRPTMLRHLKRWVVTELGVADTIYIRKQGWN